MHGFLYHTFFALYFTVSVLSGWSQTKVGLLLDDLDQDFWYMSKEYFEQRGEEIGLEVLSAGADNSPDNQINQAKDFISKGIKVLVLGSVDDNTSQQIVTIAKAANIKVIAMERFIRNADIDGYVAYDNMKMGELQTEYITKIKPTGSYILIGGPLTDVNSRMVHDGQMKILNKFAGNINIVWDKPVAEWTDMEAYMSLENYYAENPGATPDAILTSSDILSAGAIMSLETKGMDGNVTLAGLQADGSTYINLIKGKQTLSIFKSPKLLGITCADNALLLSQGQNLANVTRNMQNGKKAVPSILLTPILIDQTNVNILVQEGMVKKK